MSVWNTSNVGWCAHRFGARRTLPIILLAGCRLGDMARVAAIQILRLSDDRQIEAHVTDNGHVLLIPLCRLIRCNGKDPWRRGRKTLESVVKKIVTRGGAGENVANNDLVSQHECGARAMHHLVVDSFLQQYYHVSSVQSVDLESLGDTVAGALSGTPTPPMSATPNSVTDSDAAAGTSINQVDRQNGGNSDDEQCGGVGLNVRLVEPHGSERARTEDVFGETSDKGRTQHISDEPMIIQYDGTQWVDAVAEWDAVPEHLQYRKAMWHVRLGGVGISIATCRVAKVGNIRTLAEPHTGGSKSVYVPLTLWTTMLERVRSAVEDRSDDRSDNIVHCELEQSLLPLKLHPDETFHHDGAVLNIATYGERSKGGFYASYDDFVKALAVRQSSRMPNVKVFTARIGVCTSRSITVLGFRSMLRLVALYADKSSVASALMDWVTDVVFSAQFGDGACVQKQGAYAARAGLADRSAPYSACDWSFNGVHASVGLYQDEVCSGVSARANWATQVDAALARLPDGTNIDDTSVVKAGHTVNKADRSRNIRTAMRKAFGPETDVRTISFSRCPGGTRDTLTPLEMDVLEEFDQYRLRGVQAFPGQEQVELFLVTPAISQRIASSLSVAAEKFATSRLAEADARVRESDARVSATAVLEERASRLMQENDRVKHEYERVLRDFEHEKRRTGGVGAALRECLDDRDASAQTVIHRITRALV